GGVAVKVVERVAAWLWVLYTRKVTILVQMKGGFLAKWRHDLNFVLAHVADLDDLPTSVFDDVEQPTAVLHPIQQRTREGVMCIEQPPSGVKGVVHAFSCIDVQELAQTYRRTRIADASHR